MLKALLKKQLTEIFRAYIYDEKKKRARSKGSQIFLFSSFAFLMIVIIGGMFASLAVAICRPTAENGYAWLYYLLFFGMSVLMGIFGSVFSTYSGLYLAKDNDLLLSMPIPVGTIMTSRLLSVYILGAMYSLAIFLPPFFVALIFGVLNGSQIIFYIITAVLITLLVMTLSCVLGWVVARCSRHLKHKSFSTVLISLLFIFFYYFIYFKLNTIVQRLITETSVYGEAIKQRALPLYYFAQIGEGRPLPLLIFALCTLAALALTWIVIKRSFLKIVTTSHQTTRLKEKGLTTRQKTAFGALLSKELCRFTSSANYMLNCGIGCVFLLALAVLIVTKGDMLYEMLSELTGGRDVLVGVAVTAALSLAAGMINPAAPSVSLEGKSLWIVKSLPVKGALVLRAKLALQLLLSTVPALIAGIICVACLPIPMAERLLVIVSTLCACFLAACIDTTIAIRHPMLTWTTELTPIKQSFGVFLSLFSGILPLLLALVYIFLGYKFISPAVYLTIMSVLQAGIGAILLRWINTKGEKILELL